MRQITYEEPDTMIAWAEEIIGFSFRPDARAIGMKRGDRYAAVAVFDGFSPCDCNIHIASDGSGNWLNKDFLISCFSFPFVQLGLRRVTGLVPARNVRALRFDLHLGFKVEGKCRNALPDDDIIVLGMLREECLFIPTNHRS